MTDPTRPNDPLATAARAAAQAQTRVLLGSAAKLLLGLAAAVIAVLTQIALTGYAVAHYLPTWAVTAVAVAAVVAIVLQLARIRRQITTAADTPCNHDPDHEHTIQDLDQIIMEGPDGTSRRRRAIRVGRVTSWTILAAAGGWVLLGWPGVAIAVTAGAYRLWFVYRGVRRRWTKELGPLFRMSTTRGFDQTPEI